MTKQVVTTLKMMPVTESVAIHFIGTHIAEDGTFQGTEGMAEAMRRDARRDRPVRRGAAPAARARSLTRPP